MAELSKQVLKNNPLNVRKEVETYHRVLYLRHMLGSFIGSLVIVIITLITLKGNSTSDTLLYTWLASISFFMVFRVIQGYMFYNSPVNSKEAHRWGKLMSIYTIGAGITWGLSPYVFHPSGTHELIFSALYATGLIAASIVSLSGSIRDFVYFSGAISICMVTYHVSSDYPYSNYTGFLFFLFFLCSFYFSRNVMLLQKSSRDLIDKNIDLINKLVIEKENAERSNKEKTHFIANASHDLRQPLHALGLYLDSLGNEGSKEKKKQVLEKSKSSLKSLDDLFSSLLDISNIDAGAITIAPLHFRVNQLFEQILDQIKGNANEKNIHIETQVYTDQIVFCDPLLTARCLRNVAINAIKHADCTELKIQCTALKNAIQISIIDNGKGIAEENLGKIFQEFEQLDNPNRDRQKGLGLGLTIVKRLLELQGYPFRMTSSIGNGTTFSFKLPLGSEQYVSNIIYREKNERKIDFIKSILVIDDEQQVLDGMNLILRDWQQNICIANSAKQAINFVDKGFMPDIIISDYRLQNNQTGADVINHILDQLPKHTQIVFITGETEPSKIKEVRSHGYPLIHKPIMGAGLKSMLIRLHNNPTIGQVKLND